MDIPSNASGASGTMEDRPKDDLPHVSKDMKDCAEAPNVNPTCNSDNGGTTGFEAIQQNVDVTRDTELGIDILLQRHRNEIMFELRRLQLGDRPVTGSEERRQAINNLVVRCTGSTVNSTDQIADVSLMTNSQRPEQVLVEVNALVERRPVSSILQSAAFRSSLEQSLRNALGNQSVLLNRGRQQQHQQQQQQQQHQHQHQQQHQQQPQQHQPMRAYSTRDAAGFAAASVPDIGQPLISLNDSQSTSRQLGPLLRHPGIIEKLRCGLTDVCFE